MAPSAVVRDYRALMVRRGERTLGSEALRALRRRPSHRSSRACSRSARLGVRFPQTCAFRSPAVESSTQASRLGSRAGPPRRQNRTVPESRDWAGLDGAHVLATVLFRLADSA